MFSHQIAPTKKTTLKHPQKKKKNCAIIGQHQTTISKYHVHNWSNIYIKKIMLLQ